MWWKVFEEIKLSLLSLLIFAAWVIAGEGWVRALAVMWLVYPLVVAFRAARRRAS